MLHISPSEFWNMSLVELNCAIEGFKEFNGSKKSKVFDQEELKELMELYPD